MKFNPLQTKPAYRRGHTSPAVATKIVKAVKLIALGYTQARAARHLGMTKEGLRGLRKRHPELWEAAYEGAIKAVARQVRRKAGRNLGAMDVLMRCADAVENSRVPLFVDPADELTRVDGSQHTVPSFLEKYLIPNRLQDASPETVGAYRKAARKFAVAMGNPQLCSITNEMLATFRKILEELPARGKKGAMLKVNTVRFYLEHLQGILDKAGPPGPRNRDAAGFLAVVPWVKPPREELGETQIVPDETLARCYAAAETMSWPRVPWATPAAWWQALLVTTRYLGPRSRTLFKLKLSMIDWEGRRMAIPAKLLKSRKKMVFPLPPAVCDHLAAIRSDRELLFEWPHSSEWFRKCLHKLQTLAGVDLSKHFGLHTLRKTAITQTWKRSPAAAQLLAGHGSPIITRMHYVNEEEVLREVLDDLTAEPFAGQPAGQPATAGKSPPATQPQSDDKQLSAIAAALDELIARETKEGGEAHA